MAWLRHAGREDSVLDGVSPPLRGLASDFGKTRSLWQITPKVFSPTCSPSFVGFPRFTRLSYGTRRWALTSTIHGVGQSPLRTSMSLRQTGPSVARPIPVWPMAQRRSLGVLPRGLDKRAHLGEQQGATPNPPHRGWLTASGVFETVIGRDVISDPPLAHSITRLDCRTYATGVIDMVAQGKNNCEYNSKRHTSLSGNGFILKAR